MNGTERGICLMTTKWGVNIMVDLVLPLHLGIGVLVEMIGLDVLPLDMKGCICHFTAWQTHPVISMWTMYVLICDEHLLSGGLLGE